MPTPGLLPTPVPPEEAARKARQREADEAAARRRLERFGGGKGA